MAAARRLLAPSITGQFLRLLATTTINDFMQEMEVVVVDRETPVGEVLKTCKKAGVMSVPVVDNNNADKFVGMFDVEDFIGAVLRHIEAGEDHKVFLEKPVVKFINPSTYYEVFHPVASDLSLYHVLELFTRGTHRVPVTDNHLKIVSVVSQSQALRFINKNSEKIGENASKFVEDLGLGMKGVEAITADTPTIEAFDLMVKKGLTSVAIVDADGKFTNELTAQNLRGLSKSFFADLKLPVGEFIEKRVSQKAAQKCTLSTIFKDLLAQMAGDRSHRVWVENSKGQLKGVITLTDIMKTLLKTMNMTSHEKVRRRSIA